MEVIIFRTLKRSIFVKMANFDRKIENFDSKWHFLRLEQNQPQCIFTIIFDR